MYLEKGKWCIFQVEYAEKHNNRAAGRNFSVSESCGGRNFRPLPKRHLPDAGQKKFTDMEEQSCIKEKEEEKEKTHICLSKQLRW